MPAANRHAPGLELITALLALFNHIYIIRKKKRTHRYSVNRFNVQFRARVKRTLIVITEVARSDRVIKVFENTHVAF